MYSPYVLWLAIVESLSWVLANLSYIDTYLFVIAHFDQAGFWYGATFADLLWSWMPSSMMQSKPPVDDGVYLRSLAEGLIVHPGAAAASLYPSSWPPETFGAAYMNFGIPGVILFHLMLGFIIRAAIEFARAQEFSFVSVFVVSNVVLNFELTNLRIVQLMTTLAVAYGVVAIAAVIAGGTGRSRMQARASVARSLESLGRQPHLVAECYNPLGKPGDSHRAPDSGRTRSSPLSWPAAPPPPATRMDARSGREQAGTRPWP